MQQILERQADAIEAVLAAHKIESRVWGGTVLPRYVRYQLTTTSGTRVGQVLKLNAEIAMSLGASEVRMYRKHGAISVEVPTLRTQAVRLIPLCNNLTKVPLLTAVLGVDEDGVPLLLRLPSPDVAHVLIAGTTGSGKTVLLRSLLLSLAMYTGPEHLRMALIDPKGRGFGALAQLPHLYTPVAAQSENALCILEGLVNEMEIRDREKRSDPAVVVAVDELADLRMTGGKRVEESLTRLTQRGREAGIHVILATQRPAATVVGSLVKANLPVRLVGSVNSPEDAKMASGIARSGAERLQGRGDFLLVARSATIRLQVAHVTENEMTAVIRNLPGGGYSSDLASRTQAPTNRRTRSSALAC